MDDDINVQNGIAVVYALAKYANVYAQQPTVVKGAVESLQTLLQDLVAVFGIKLAVATIADEEIEALIEQRNQARQAKDFALSDQIRDDLKAQGIILEDTPQGTRYRKE